MRAVEREADRGVANVVGADRAAVARAQLGHGVRPGIRHPDVRSVVGEADREAAHGICPEGGSIARSELETKPS